MGSRRKWRLAREDHFGSHGAEEFGATLIDPLPQPIDPGPIHGHGWVEIGHHEGGAAHLHHREVEQPGRHAAEQLLHRIAGVRDQAGITGGAGALAQGAPELLQGLRQHHEGQEQHEHRIGHRHQWADQRQLRR